MKKIYCLSLIILSAMLMSGCFFDEKDKFDDVATVRMTETLNEYRKILVGSENGWSLDYYTQKKQANRGTTILCKFHENGTVDIASIDKTNLPARQVATSEFDMIGTQGPVLSISEYNPVLHYYCEPNVGIVEGREIGDYEFIIMSATADEIILKGKKWSNYMIMRKMESPDWDAYFTAAVRHSSIYNFVFFGLKMSINNVEYESSMKGRLLNVKAKDGENFDIAFTCTNLGLRFYKDITIDGITMRDFTYNSETSEFICSDPGVNAKLSVFDQSEPNNFLSRYDRFPISLDHCSETVANSLKQALGRLSTWRPTGVMYMGYSLINSYLFSSFVMPFASGSSSYNCIFPMTFAPVEDDDYKMSVVSWTTSGGLNTSQFVTAGFGAIFNEMIAKSPYTMIESFPVLLLKSDSDPDFVIALIY